MLAYDGATVNTYHLSAREGLVDNAKSLCIEVGLGIGRAEHGSVDNEEVGIGGRQSLTVFVIDRSWQGEFSQS